MIQIYEITLDHENLSSQMGSLFHGILMKNFSAEFADKMHRLPQNPYTQYLYKNEDAWKWRICALTQEASQEIESFFENLGETLFVEHKQWKLTIAKKEKTLQTSIDTLIERAYGMNKAAGYFRVEFVTPTSFKSQEQYQNMPTAELIMKSLINKFNSCSPRFIIEGEDVLCALHTKVSIEDYKLRSIKYHLESTKIPAFTGQVGLKVNGPRQLKELVGLLISISPYTGIGMKTSLGMGGIKLGR